MRRLHVVGVRHHSPACARLVAHVIDTVRPRYVLIEGPVDMNGRIDELLLGHELPIAVFSYAQGAERHHASWSPFCAYSPEWVAITEGRRIGAEARFIDLPAWDDAFRAIENRYSDRIARVSVRLAALCARLGVEDTDALWDHLFEQPSPLADLSRRLEIYFHELREGDDALERDVRREVYMADWIGWALGAGGPPGDVVVVCGGYHAPVLARARAAPGAEEPAAPPAPEGLDRTGSYLVPYSFHRLDAFVGYESGMPSPEFYQRVWEEGCEAAGERMLFAAITHLRAKRQRVSPADAIAALSLARGLRMIRGHAELARIDVLDGLAAAVVKDALDAPLPWTRRGTLQRGTDPMLVAIVAAFSGDRIGKLAPETPHPPLVADAFAELVRVGVPLTRDKAKLEVVLTDPAGLARSRVLHRLRVLGIPGFALLRSPTFDRDRTVLAESWSVSRVLDAEASLIEASLWGATLESAAAAKLEGEVAEARGVAALARILRTAAAVGIGTLARRVAEDVRRAASVEPSFADLGAGLADLVAQSEHDVLLGAKDAPILGEAIVHAFERGLWLVEGLDGVASEAEVRGVVALRDAQRQLAAKLPLDTARASAVMHRRATDPSAPAPVRGAAFGFGWSTGAEIDEGAAELAIKGAARPETLGDFLTGLFALAREEVIRAASLLEVLDRLITPMTSEDFLVAIPALRLAFSWFPPREKELIAKRILAIHGGGSDPKRLVRLEVDAQVTLRGRALDAEVDGIAKRFGLGEVTS